MATLLPLCRRSVLADSATLYSSCRCAVPVQTAYFEQLWEPHQKRLPLCSSTMAQIIHLSPSTRISWGRDRSCGSQFSWPRQPLRAKRVECHVWKTRPGLNASRPLAQCACPPARLPAPRWAVPVFRRAGQSLAPSILLLQYSTSVYSVLPGSVQRSLSGGPAFPDGVLLRQARDAPNLIARLLKKYRSRRLPLSYLAYPHFGFLLLAKLVAHSRAGTEGRRHAWTMISCLSRVAVPLHVLLLFVFRREFVACRGTPSPAVH